MYLFSKGGKNMSSLFNDSCCDSTKGAQTTKCKGCVCQTLNQLANRNMGDICSMGRPQRVLIVNKGTDEPLFLNGSTNPTEFTLVRFDPESCCAVFTFEVPDATQPDARATRTFVTDCRSIAGIICLQENI
jgi:hypothetical protein